MGQTDVKVGGRCVGSANRVGRRTWMLKGGNGGGVRVKSDCMIGHEIRKKLREALV